MQGIGEVIVRCRLACGAEAIAQMKSDAEQGRFKVKSLLEEG